MRTNLWIVSGLVLAGAVMTAYCLPLPGKETRYTLVKDEEAGEDKPKDEEPVSDIPFNFQPGYEFVVKITTPILSNGALFQDIWDKLMLKFPPYLGVQVTFFAQAISASTTSSNFIMINSNPAAYAILVEIFAVGSTDNDKTVSGVQKIRSTINDILNDVAGNGPVLAKPVYLLRYNCDISTEVGEYLTYSVEDLDGRATGIAN